MKKLYPFLFFILTGFSLYGQYYQTGQDPASIRWKQINTPSFQLIFPDYYEEQAKKLAGNLETVYPYAGFTLKHNPAKIPVVLHTQTVQSNGLVAWAPKRAEFFTTPHQSIYPQEWLEQLALHEVRHVVQVDKIQNNLPRWVRYLLGEQGTALAFGIYLKWWFIEGDAVITETALSDFGRGRLPSFLMEHKAQVVEKGVFSYDKEFFGSYHDFVPKHYNLGYYLSGNLRARHGSELWEEVLTKAGSNPLSIVPMQKVLKKRTGLNIEQSYRSVFDSLKIQWQKEDKQYGQIPHYEATGKNRFFTNYKYNSWLNDSVLFSYKTAYDEIPSFVKIELNDNKESKIAIPGSVFNESVGYSHDWVIWSEQIRDVRWQHSGRSLIRLFNSKTDKKIEFEPEFKSLNPSISPDGKKVVVVEADFSHNHYLTVYRIHDGTLLDRFQTDQNSYFFSPEWINDDEIAAIILTSTGKQIIKYSISNHEMKSLLKTDLGDIKHLECWQQYLYFIGSYTGKNSLYRLNMDSNVTELIYEPRFDAESPAISEDGTRIALSDYSSDGYRIIIISSAHDSIKRLEALKPHKYLLAETLASQEAGQPVFADSVTANYEVESYSKLTNLFNFHSWGPVYIYVDSYEFHPDVSLMSQNVLGTSEAVVGYKWDPAERTGRFVANYLYSGWYPVFDLEFSYGQRASHYNLIRRLLGEQGTVVQDTVQKRFTWDEARGVLKTELPLVFNKGAYNRLIQPEIQYTYTFYGSNRKTPDNFNQLNHHSLIYQIYMHQLRKRSYLDVYPETGIVINGSYGHSPAGATRTGDLKSVVSTLYLPGFMKNHGIRFNGGTQHKTEGATLFNDVVRMARGWGRINTTSLSTIGIDYKLPVVYPDWRIGGLLYTRRINLSLFGDYSKLKGNFYSNGSISGNWVKNITSTGAELTADINFLRFYAPATIGVRASYLPELKQTYYDFLFSIDFTSF